jgi:hypothetical protein
MRMRLTSRSLVSLGLLVATLGLGTTDAHAADAPIATVEVEPPPPSSGIDVSAIRDAAEGAIRQLDRSSIRDRRRVVVSIALTRAATEGPVVCTVNATLRDARTGTMIAVIEAGARAEGPASVEVRKQVAQGAVRSAVRRIPSALGGK